MDVPGTVEDLLGNPVAVRDQIAGAFRIGNVAVLRVGTVLGFGERGNKLTVKVQWHHDSQYPGETVGAIEADLKRFVKIQNATPLITAIHPAS
jgi:hypothetical protein